MNGAEVAVVGMGLFLPGRPNVQAHVAGVVDEGASLPAGTSIPLRERRRTSVLTKAFADVYTEALSASGAEGSTVSSVFGSALGEAATMIGLLDQMWGPEGTLSPMRFVMSVHNAASGVISVASKNQGFTTSLGADFDTPAMSILEGIGLVLERREIVVLCCADEASPVDLVRHEGGWSLVAGALALAPVEFAPSAPRLAFLGAGTQTGLRADVDASLAANPCAGILDLVDALARGRAGVVRLDRGYGSGFGVTLRTAS